MTRALIALATLLAATAAPAHAEIQRLYVLDCGTNLGKDQSRWSPGVNEGKPIEFSDNCYLIRHSKGLLLWDTGISDAVAAMPNGLVTANGAIIQSRAKTLAAQLTELGVKPADITYVAVSHTHGDHVGNKPTFVDTQKIQKLGGDHDVFGDGSVTILSTPGHTPGHQSLLVKLPKTGALVLSGDAVHFQDNWTHKRVPSMNTNKDQTVASLDRIAKVLADQKATLWINHDKPQSATLKYSPAYYE